MKTSLWNGTPIVYTWKAISELPPDTTVFIRSPLNLQNETPRYVAVRNGVVIASELRQGFCNMFVDPLFSGNLMLLAPDYRMVDGKQVYNVPLLGVGVGRQ